jgi:hypothetical protein
MPGLEEPGDDDTADVAGTTGYEDVHSISPKLRLPTGRAVVRLKGRTMTRSCQSTLPAPRGY